MGLRLERRRATKSRSSSLRSRGRVPGVIVGRVTRNESGSTVPVGSERRDCSAEGGRDAFARVHLLDGERATECAQDEADLFGVDCGTGVVPQELLRYFLQRRGAKR